MMLGWRFLFKAYHKFGDCLVWSRAKPPNVNKEVVPFPDNIAALFLNNHRMHTVVTDVSGNILETNERVA